MGLNTRHLLTVTVVAALCLFRSCLAADAAVHAKKGGTAVLTCSLDLPGDGPSAPKYVVEWVRQGYEIPILIKFGVYAPRVHPRYEGRVSLTGGTALRIGGLVLEDEGRYECRVLLLDRPSDEARNGSWTLLSVSAPPVFAETPAPVNEALLGRALDLRCVVHGSPLPTVTWLKDGTAIKQRDNVKVENGTLSFRSVSRDSAGEYECRASNTDGNVTHVTRLKVKGPPVIITPPKDTVLNMSQNAVLQCQAEADPPNMTYVWQRQGENVYHIETLKSRVKILVDGTLLIPRLTPEDSGNYTCMPTNGLLTPPSASACLTVKHPAEVVQMPKQTFLPTGMRGFIPCPVRAEPPLTRVDWTKDGQPLDMGKYPGWTLTAEGSVFMATANDDAAGVYTCTPYNSYGTMGQSEPTTVILLDPPSFKVPPRGEYREEVGKMLIIPCQTNGEPASKVYWKKVGPSPRSEFSVAANGSLILQPLRKDHQGAWECSTSNRVATVSASTTVLVLGTSPHAVFSVSVSPRIHEANVSWEPGFDGGYTQRFTVWLTPVSGRKNRTKQEWLSVPVKSSGNSIVVTGLLPATEYQFSVLAQNKVGTGPFSEIVTARTLDAAPVVTKLDPPTLLSSSPSSEGIVLGWLPPVSQSPMIDGYVLQSRHEQGEWSTLDEDISPNKTQMLIQGLYKDSVYELRMLSRRGERLSAPSQSINVSTMGMDMYPTSSRLLEFVPKPLLAGVMGGVGIFCFVLLLTLGTVCIIGHRRSQQRRQRQRRDLPPTPQKTSPVTISSAPGSPDSVLKQKLLPSRSLSGSSTSSQSDHSSYDKSGQSEDHGQRQQLLPRPHPASSRSIPETHLHRAALPVQTSPLDFIYRGPDGRFIMDSHDVSTIDTARVKRNLRKDFAQSGGNGVCKIRKSHSLRSHRDEKRNPPFVLSVDLPPPGQKHERSKHLSLPGRFYLTQEQTGGSSDRRSELSSLSSESSESGVYTLSEQRELPRDYLSLKRGSTRSTASTLVLQMEHEREQANLNRCLTLAREREKLEQELRRYTLERSSESEVNGNAPEREEAQRRDVGEDGLVWKSLENTLPHGSHRVNRGHCAPKNTLNTDTSSSYQWEAKPLVSPTSLAPSSISYEEAAEYSQIQYDTPSPPCSSAGIASQRVPRSPERREWHSQVKHSQRRGREITGSPPVCVVDGSFVSMTTEKAHFKLGQSQRSSGNFSHSQEYFDRLVPHDTECYVEMSVDEPEIQSQMPPLTKSNQMSDRSHKTHTCSLPYGERKSENEVETFASQRMRCRGDGENRSSSSNRALSASKGSGPALRKTLSLGSQNWPHHKNGQSLDSKKVSKEQFLTPDAWIHSLSLGRATSMSPYAFRPDSLNLEPQSDPAVKCYSKHGRSLNGSLSPSRHKSLAGTPQQLGTNPSTPLGSPPQDSCHQASAGDLDTPLHPAPVDSHPAALTLGDINMLSSHQHSQPIRETVNPAKEKGEEQEEEEQEVDVEIGGYQTVAESEGSYRSYASQSSGRGSMDPPNSRQSFSLSPTLTSSAETAEESDRDEAVHGETGGEEGSSRRRTSADENYEWDTAGVPRQPLDRKTSVRNRGPERETSRTGEQWGDSPKRCGVASDLYGRGLMASVPLNAVPGIHPPSSEPITETLLSKEIQLGSVCYPDSEPETVLF